jgi:hypothetical protein
VIDAAALLKDGQRVASLLVDDLRVRAESDEESRVWVNGQFDRAVSAERTAKSLEEWREDLLAQVASSWVIACVFVRFCEDNGLVDVPLLSGPGERLGLARDHRSSWLSEHPTEGDRAWLLEVFGRSAQVPGLSGVLRESNPVWSLAPSEDGARALLDLWWSADDDGTLTHDFEDAALDTRFLGDLYQDLSKHAKKHFALLQTPDFIESFILDRTLDPAVETFGLETVRMIDPTCGSGHFLLGAFGRLLEAWRQAEPATEARTLVQRALDAVNGVDLNPVATAIARFRLLVAALQGAGIGRLANAPDFTINVATGDSLLHGLHIQDELVHDHRSITRHFYAAEDREQAAAILETHRYHAVVGNPPYITVKDPAVRDAVRALYPVCSGKYALSVPFVQRFHDLAQLGSGREPAGYVGQITSNSFMKRQMGRSLVNDYLPSQNLTHIIDCSGAHIPGHNSDGTPTVILLSRHGWPSGPIRAVLGIAGESGAPGRDGGVWGAIERQIDNPGSESEFISVDDVPRETFASHPWTLQGGAMPAALEVIATGATRSLSDVTTGGGFLGISGADEAFLVATVPLYLRSSTSPIVKGRDVRDWLDGNPVSTFFPYDSSGQLHPLDACGPWEQMLWPLRTTLWSRMTFGGATFRDAGRAYHEWHQLVPDRLRVGLSLSFGQVATHNHFVLKSMPLSTQTAPIVDVASLDVALELAGLLNSSTAMLWMRATFYDKGTGSEPWERRIQIDAGKLNGFPIPTECRTTSGLRMHEAAERLANVLPAAVAASQAPTAVALAEPRKMGSRLRHAMVALQEELDWECYRLYGLTDEALILTDARLPEVEKGQRAFEIALARRMVAGEATTTWFERHDSTPITEIPAHWPEDYRQLVQRRLDLIEADRSIRLLEQPEHKRRWNWDSYDDLTIAAQERWLADRIESYLSSGDSSAPEPTTAGRLADRLARDEDARQVAEDLEGSTVDLVKLVGRLVVADGVPYLAGYRLKPSGLRKRLVWERTWDLQRAEDAIDARVTAGELTESEAAVERKEQGLEKIPVPPKYSSGDYRDQGSWKHRGKLDVPKERFVLYPGTRLGADSTAVVGWAGWDHLQQGRALAGLFVRRKQDGAGRGELGRLLAGVQEVLPWVLQWHDDPDPQTGDRMGQFLSGFVTAERQALGLTDDELIGAGPLAIED